MRKTIRKIRESIGDYSYDVHPTHTGISYNQTNQMGDNPMPIVEGQDIDDAALDRLYAALKKAGKLDSDIAVMNIKFKHDSMAKIAAMVAGEPMANPKEYLDAALMALATRMVPDKKTELNEFISKSTEYVHVVDTLGNVRITSSDTGKSVTLVGEDALELLGELEQYGKTPEAIQKILGHYQHVMEATVDMNGSVATTPVGNDLRSLKNDLTSMKRKMDALLVKSEREDDLVGSVAAQTFLDEIEKMSLLLDEYL